jgi:uncharacterized iron-regulated membrane protein
MNRLIVALLSVLIVLVAANGFLVWRAGEQARDEAELQTCIQRSEATAVIALLAPALISPSDEEGSASRLAAVKALSTQLDGC